MSAFEGLLKIADKLEIQRVRKALLEYCKLDTLGMVKILESDNTVKLYNHLNKKGLNI